MSVDSFTQLNDIVALFATNHGEKILCDGIDPLDLPCVDPRIVNPQRRAIGIDVGRGSAMTQFAASRHDPDILDGAAFQNPAEMPLALTLTLRPVVEKPGDVEIPGADQPSVEVHLAGAIGGRAVSGQRIEKTGRDHAASRSSAFLMASA